METDHSRHHTYSLNMAPANYNMLYIYVYLYIDKNHNTKKHSKSFCKKNNQMFRYNTFTEDAMILNTKQTENF